MVTCWQSLSMGIARWDSHTHNWLPACLYFGCILVEHEEKKKENELQELQNVQNHKIVSGVKHHIKVCLFTTLFFKQSVFCVHCEN